MLENARARTCKVLRIYINAFSSYSAKTKRDGQTALQYLPSRAFGETGDKNQNYYSWVIWSNLASTLE